MRSLSYFKSLMLVMMAFTVAAMTAANVDSRAAQARAIRFMNSQPGTRMMASNANLKLTHAEKSAVDAKANDYYVFNYEGGGYVIVSGDDRAEEILGYGSGRMDVNNLPSNVAWWLNQYKQQMEWLIANPKAQVETTTQFMSTMLTATTVPMLMSSRPSVTMNSGKRPGASALARTPMRRAEQAWPPTMKGMRLPSLVSVRSERRPKSGSRNKARMLSAAMIQPDTLSPMWKVSRRMRGMI